MIQSQHVLSSAGQLLTSNRQLLSAYDPTRRLAQGWSIVTGADGAVVRSIGDLAIGEVVRVRVSDGSFDAGVKEKNGAT
jgi:exonuclease VII large subunit